MLTRFKASQEQIDKIVKDYLPKVYNVHFTPNKEGGYVWCCGNKKGTHEFHHHASEMGWPVLQWRIDSNGTPLYFELWKNSLSYDVSRPEDELYKRLKEIGLKAKEDFWNAGQL